MAWQTGKVLLWGQEGRVCPDNLPRAEGGSSDAGQAAGPHSQSRRPRARCPSRTGSKASPAALRTCRLSCVRPTHRHTPPAGHRRGCGSFRPPARPLRVLLCWRLRSQRPVLGASRSLAPRSVLTRLSRQARGLCHPPGREAAAAFPAPSCGCFSLIRGWLEAGGRGRAQTCPLLPWGLTQGNRLLPVGRLTLCYFAISLRSWRI